MFCDCSTLLAQMHVKACLIKSCARNVTTKGNEFDSFLLFSWKRWESSVRFLTSYRSTIERTYTRSKGGCETKRKNLSFDRNSLCINYVIRSVGRTRSQSNVLSKPTTYSDAKNSRIDRSTRNVSSSIKLATISSHLKEFPLARTTRVHPRNCIQEYLSFSPSISSGSISEYNSSAITIRKYIYIDILLLSIVQKEMHSDVMYAWQTMQTFFLFFSIFHV